jgi:hypothetical protein
MLEVVSGFNRRCFLGALLFLSLVGCGSASAQQRTDPLPSWNDGAAKQAIVGFVDRVTQEGGSEFVPAEQRIATFDNDGTLWAEQPIYFQIAFAMDRVKALAAQHPEWRETQPFKAVIEGDLKTLAAIGEKGFHRPYTELAYQPMLELLAYLRERGFKTFIVSGGGVEFMRVFAERVYGIPPEQVVGSSGVVKFELEPDGKPVLLKEAEIEFVDDGPGKPVGINRFIGRRPIMAFGNSDGDLQMLQWTTAGDGPRFGLIVHHDDAVREWAYDRDSHIGRLDQALDLAPSWGWVVVSMKGDWRTIFANPPQ